MRTPGGHGAASRRPVRYDVGRDVDVGVRRQRVEHLLRQASDPGAMAQQRGAVQGDPEPRHASRSHGAAS